MTVEGSLFDFIQNQFNNPKQPGTSFEREKLDSNCNEYICPDTGVCVKEAKYCPCPYPLSQLRCFLPNGNYICISKPAGGDLNYNDPQTNWKVDAKDDDIRDCGWVSRYYKGQINS